MRFCAKEISAFADMFYEYFGGRKGEVMKIEIKSVEIFDSNKEYKLDDEPLLSNVSVIVYVLLDNEEHSLEYQTTTTSDCGAISTRLDCRDESVSFRDLDNWQAIANKIKKIAKVQDEWQIHIKANYIQDDSYYGGMDGRSVNDKCSYVI